MVGQMAVVEQGSQDLLRCKGPGCSAQRAPVMNREAKGGGDEADAVAAPAGGRVLNREHSSAAKQVGWCFAVGDG